MKKVIFLLSLLLSCLFASMYLYKKDTRQVVMNLDSVEIYFEGNYSVYKSSDYVIVVKTEDFDVISSTMNITNNEIKLATTYYYFVDNQGIIYISTYTVRTSTRT